MEPEECVLVIDAGTTGVRALLQNKLLHTVHSEYERIPDSALEHPSPGWVSMDPEAVWTVTRDVATRTLKSEAAESRKVVGVALTTQRASVLFTDETGKPVTPFVPWQDARSAEICDAANTSLMLHAVQGSSSLLHFVSRSPKFKAGSVWTFSPVMACTKVAWLFRNDPNLNRLASEGRLRYGGLDSWILFKLLGEKYWGTERSNWSAMGFYDPWTDGPSTLVYKLLGIPASVRTPFEKPSSGFWGEIPAEVFGKALPLVTVVSDQGAAVAGEGCFNPGEAKITLGSGAFFNLTTGVGRDGKRGGTEVQYPYEGVYPLVAFDIGNESVYMVEGSEPACGTGLDWAGSAFGLWDDIATTSEAAFSVPDSQGVNFVPALFGLRAPHHNNKCKGAFIGLTTAAQRPHIIRAVLEGLCWRILELLNSINLGPTKVRSVRLGGGVARNDFICQFLADIMQIPVHRTADVEGTARGATVLAGLHLGWFQWTAEGKDALKKLIYVDETVFQPKMSAVEREKRWLLWVDATQRVCM